MHSIRRPRYRRILRSLRLRLRIADVMQATTSLSQEEIRVLIKHGLKGRI